jgi:hypothetical protein
VREILLLTECFFYDDCTVRTTRGDAVIVADSDSNGSEISVQTPKEWEPTTVSVRRKSVLYILSRFVWREGRAGALFGGSRLIQGDTALKCPSPLNVPKDTY